VSIFSFSNNERHFLFVIFANHKFSFLSVFHLCFVKFNFYSPESVICKCKVFCQFLKKNFSVIIVQNHKLLLRKLTKYLRTETTMLTKQRVATIVCFYLLKQQIDVMQSSQNKFAMLLVDKMKVFCRLDALASCLLHHLLAVSHLGV